MAEWFLPAIISYQAIHNGLNEEKIEEYTLSKTKDDLINYLASKTISINSKTPANPRYWSSKKLDYLRKAFTAVKMSDEENNIFDVRTLYKRTLKDVDLLTYSFPCQDLSQQGIQKGMAKNSETRSGLLWEIEKALDHTKKQDLPKFLVMENVTALMHSTNKEDLTQWMNKLTSLGYKNSIGILNSSDFGSAQARRRAFMISTLGSKTELPTGDVNSKKAIKDILNAEPTRSDFITALYGKDWTEPRLTKSNIMKGRINNYTSFNSEAYIYDKNFTGPTLTASGANSRIKIIEGKRVRKMNAAEAYRYMGFEDADYDKVSALQFLNESQMIYTCGNSISVEVLKAIFLKIGENNE